jgi:hypothetical protein
MRHLICCCLLLASCFPVISIAGETIAYSYDAKGRLVKVSRTGTVNNGAQLQFSYDKANNRKSRVVTGGANAPAMAPALAPAVAGVSGAPFGISVCAMTCASASSSQ